MFIHQHDEKLAGAIAYFVGNTRHCYTLKLFKLLNFLDFEHYRQTGWPVTGLDYFAYELGPVPVKLYQDMEQEGDKQDAVMEVRETFDDVSNTLVKRVVKPKTNFDENYFTPRELEIMEQLVFFFVDAKSEVMSAHSHDSKSPWKKVYGKGEGKTKIIPYQLALHAAPIVHHEPTIDEQGLLLLDDTFAGTGLR